MSAAVFNEESTEEQKMDHESVSFDTGTVSVIEEEEPTDLDCSESLMTIKSYRDTQKKVTKSGRVTKMLTFFKRKQRSRGELSLPSIQLLPNSNSNVCFFPTECDQEKRTRNLNNYCFRSTSGLKLSYCTAHVIFGSRQFRNNNLTPIDKIINLMSRLFDYRLTMELEKNQKQADKIKKALCMYKPKFDEQGK